MANQNGYQQLFSDDDEAQGCSEKVSNVATSRRSARSLLYYIVIVQTTIILIFCIREIYSAPLFSVTEYTPGIRSLPQVRRKADLPSPFWSSNETSTNQAWESIQAGHGVVLMDKEWAAAQSLPSSREYYKDPSKSLYVISAYHAIHCLQGLRRHYLALSGGLPVTWSWDHDMHCFDSLRQYVMCQADDTLLYTTGKRDAGHGQERVCKDWDKLRQWATDHTGCYSDWPYPAPVSTRWGDCDGGDDGLPKGSLV